MTARGAALRQKSGNAESGGKDRRRDQMQRDRSVGGAGADAGQRSAGQHQHVRIAAHRPFGEHDEDERRGGADRAGGGIAAPGDGETAGDQEAEYDDRSIGMKAVQHDQGRAGQIGRERAG